MKNFILLFTLIFVLAACNNEESDSTVEGESVDETEEHSEEYAHDHDSELELEMMLDNGTEPSVLSAELHMDGEPYEADRVRFEIVNTEDEEDIEWADAEAEEKGLYSAELENIEPGTYNVVLHVNGPEDLHEHTDQEFEIE